LADFKQSLSKLLPGVKTYLVAWSRLGRFRLPHFRPLRGLVAPAPEVLVDRPTSETDSINVSSEKYFEQPELREFWHNRPFSHPDSVGKTLERFGQLLSSLRIQPGDRVLDFGCGTGWTSIMLARTGAEVIAMDIAPAALQIGREVADRELTPETRARLDFRTYSGTKLDLADGEIDFVVVFDAFHHFPNPMTILREFCRVLSPQGRFGFAEPGVGHAESEISRAETEHGILEEDLDLEQFYRTAMAAGFEGLELAIPALEPEILTLPMNRMRMFLRGMSWLVPQDFLRKAILTGPIGVFRKGAYVVTSVNPRTLAAEITPAVSQLSAKAGDAIRVRVRVRNHTETVWLKDSGRDRGFVRLGAHLLDGERAVVNNDYGRAELPTDVAQGDVVEVEMRLTAPEEAGRYTVELDMVDEGICWFAQQGSKTAMATLEVT
jgi:SAM-dependent methyltransferase